MPRLETIEYPLISREIRLPMPNNTNANEDQDNNEDGIPSVLIIALAVAGIHR